jgi:hypothetical protein
MDDQGQSLTRAFDSHARAVNLRARVDRRVVPSGSPAASLRCRREPTI